MRSLDAWVLARLASGRDGDEELGSLSVRYRPIGEHLAGLGVAVRPVALAGYLAGQPDRETIVRAVSDADPMAPAPDPSAGLRPACAADLADSAGGLHWAWPGWVPLGRVSGVGGFEGTGKTRFALDLARRVYHGLAWPDGAPMSLPAGSPSLWICGDGHQEEIALAAEAMGIPLGSVLFNATPDDPRGGVDLDDPDDVVSLDGFLEMCGAPLVFIDTLTNSTRRDLCRQNDVKALLGPLQEIAQRRRVAMVLLLHLSREGQALGRRTKGLTRTLIHLACPDPERPSRLRLWVEKSFDVKPPALGVTMGGAGNVYDDDPPEEPAVADGERPGSMRGRGRRSPKLDQCKRWLTEQLTPNPVRVTDLRADAEKAGYAVGLLYTSRSALGIDEYTLEGRRWWRIPAVGVSVTEWAGVLDFRDTDNVEFEPVPAPHTDPLPVGSRTMT